MVATTRPSRTTQTADDESFWCRCKFKWSHSPISLQVMYNTKGGGWGGGGGVVGRGTVEALNTWGAYDGLNSLDVHFSAV